VLALSGHRDTASLTEKEFLATLSRQRALDFPRGQDFDYRNTNYILLGMIASRAAGKPLAELARVRIFDPLGMKATGYVDDPDTLIPDRAVGYSKTRAGQYRADARVPRLIGDGGVFTTVRDLFRWDQYFYNENSPLLSPKLLLDAGRLNDGRPLDYAFGLSIKKYRGRLIVSHNGEFGGYRAERLQMPELRLGVVCLCNTSEADPGKLAREVVDVYGGSRLGPADPPQTESGEPAHPAQPIPQDFLAAYAGAYRSDEAQVTYRINMKDGGLFFEGAEMRYLGNDRFELDGGYLKGVRSTAGEIAGVMLTGGRLRNFPFQKMK
jgi:CubicO group peptidase (beta-lactamase class C family)